MIDMKWIRNDPEKVKENIRKKFQDEKLPLVDEVVELDQKFREAKVQGDELRSQRKSISKKIGALMGQGKKEEAEAVKAEVGAIGTKLEELEKAETELSAKGYRLHTITTSSSGSKGFLGGDRIQATMVFESLNRA